MTDLDDESDDYDDLIKDDVSSGRNADPRSTFESLLPQELIGKFEIFSYRGAAALLSQNYPDEFGQIVDALNRLEVTKTMIRMPGGSKGLIAKHVDTLFSPEWQETRISADLNVKLHHARKDTLLSEYVRKGYLDGHRIDFLCGKVAVDLEWNSKDQTYDRDLYAFSAFHGAGAIDVGVLITRGASLDNSFFRSLGKVLNKDGTDGDKDVYQKFGASTTWMGKLLYRLDAGRNGGCPVLAVGITPKCILD